MSRKDFKYGITKTSILVHGLMNNRKTDDRTAFVGHIVKVDGTIANRNIIIRFLDTTTLQFEESKYYGQQSDIIPVAEKLWPLLVAMPSLMERVSVASNADLCEMLINLTINSKIEVLYNKSYYAAIIKYIGPVETMGVGYFLGLELVSHVQITKFDGSYADKKYFNTLPGTGLFVSIDKIRPVPQFLAANTKKYSNFSSFDSLTLDSAELRVPSTTKDSIIKTAEISQIDKPRTSTQRVSFAKSNNEMDLFELIGGSWPGVTDNCNKLSNIDNSPPNNIHNSNTATISSTKLVRNKSLNPVSHLISGRKIMRNQPKNDLINISTNSSNSNTLAYSPPIYSSNINSNKNIQEDEIPIFDDISEDRITNTTYDTPNDSTTNLSVGTLVEVITDISDPLYGVIRWVGNDGLAGVELEEYHEHLPLDLTDGTYNGTRYFSCSNGRALFVPIKQCQRDSRFDDVPQKDIDEMNSSKMFGQMDSPIVPGSIPPLSMPTEEDVSAVCGKYRGIQGHHNSCYLDATLFAMFTYTGVFDSLLFRPRAPNDISRYEEVQRVLREEIVNPLRQNLYVRADRVMKLRTLLEELSSVSGLTSEEKDPEEFLNSLLAQILKAEPFLKLSSGQEAFHYQLFVEKDEGLALPSVQQLFEQSFLSSDIKLKEVPSCLIIQMPRFGKSFKMYPRILPSQLLDVTDIIENSPRQCTVCGKLAQYECRDCFGQCSVGLESTAFCAPCLETAHNHVKRSSHSPRPLTVPYDFEIIAEHCPPPRLYMELFAVVCIETSHYVAFVKCGSGHEAPWCFFDSMADRKGEQNGYNIPEMVACPDVSTWLSDDGAESRRLHDTHPNDKQLPEHARRLLCDAYICMYQSPDVMMYR